MGWKTGAPASTEWIFVGKDHRVSSLFWGKVSVSQTITRTHYVRTYDDTFHSPAHLVSDTATGQTETFYRSREQTISVVCDITVTTEELRGYGESKDGTVQAAGGQSFSLSLPAVNVTREAGRDDYHEYYYIDTAPAETATQTYPNCHGTEIVYSSRRANEAGGWVTTRTTTQMVTTIT